MSITLAQLSDFTAAATGGDFTLSAWTGKTIVLYFYPRDATPGCTLEGQEFRDRYQDFQTLGVEIFGISRDTLKSHEKFKADMQFPFELIADPEEKICNLFNVMKNKTMYGKPVRGIERSTFVIDGQGQVRKEWRGVKVPGHVNQVYEYVKNL